MYNYELALKEVENKNLSVRSDEQGHELFCYTKSCFFGDDTWNDVTKSHRGQLYYNGKPVNRPFKKIFNVDEVDETKESIVSQRMMNEPYEVLDKANGHLFIVSMFVDDQGKYHTVYSTKGSLPCEGNDLLNDDIKVFNTLYSTRRLGIFSVLYPYITLMFESVVEHDKHSMYDLQVEKYGHKNCFVLLGANIGLGLFEDDAYLDVPHSNDNRTTLREDPWVDCDHSILSDLAQIIGCPVIEKYEEVPGNILEWKEHLDREGYVIRFLSNNDRVKVKTTEYWKNRFKKDLHPEAILQIFKSGSFEKIKDKLPEEIANQCISCLNEYFFNWYHNVLLDKDVHDFIDKCDGVLSNEMAKWLFTESTFDHHSRYYIVGRMRGHKDKSLVTIKNYRDMFYDYAINSDNLYSKLQEIVYNAL